MRLCHDEVHVVFGNIRICNWKILCLLPAKERILISGRPGCPDHTCLTVLCSTQLPCWSWSLINVQILHFAEIKKSVMTETRSDRREDQIFRRRYNLPKNRSDQHNIPKRKKNTRKNNNVRKVSKQKANLMMINSLKTVPKRHFTRSGELNISKLNRWFWSWCWCCFVCLICVYIMNRRDHQLSPNKTDIQQ